MCFQTYVVWYCCMAGWLGGISLVCIVRTSVDANLDVLDSRGKVPWNFTLSFLTEFLLSYPILIVDSPLGRKDGASRICW